MCPIKIESETLIHQEPRASVATRDGAAPGFFYKFPPAARTRPAPRAAAGRRRGARAISYISLYHAPIFVARVVR